MAFPEDGQANAELERFLARLLGVPPSDVAVIRVTSGRDKVILVRTSIGQAEIHKSLSTHLR